MLTCGVDLNKKHFRIAEDSLWDYEEGYTRTGLMTAAEEGWIDIVSELVNKQVDINEDDDLGVTAPMFASEKGHVPVVSVLLADGADMSATDDNGEHAMMKAAKNGHVEVVKYFLDNGADVDMKDDQLEATILSEAAKHGHADMVSMLINQGADVNAKDEIGSDPLMEAATNGHDTIVTMLLENGADGVNNGGKYGFTPLMQSAKFPCTIAVLLGAGAEVNTQNAQDNGYTALMFAAIQCQAKTVSMLMDNGADANIADTVDGGTALMFAASRGCLETVSTLIDNGADVKIVSKDGMTALKFATRAADVEVGGEAADEIVTLLKKY